MDCVPVILDRQSQVGEQLVECGGGVGESVAPIVAERDADGVASEERIFCYIASSYAPREGD